MGLSYHERMLETNAIGIENPETENKSAQTDIGHREKQPAQNEKQEQPERIR